MAKKNVEKSEEKEVVMIPKVRYTPLPHFRGVCPNC